MTEDRQGWRPDASLEALRFVAALRADIRAWFDARGALEVVTPVLSGAAPSDVHLDALRTVSGADVPTRYLQTSPEYPMKRLLAAHGTDLWQIAPVFRAGERGRYHNPEFTMLEWYRVGIDHVALMDEVEALVRALWGRGGRPWRGAERCDCHALIERVLAERPDRGRPAEGAHGAEGTDEERFVDAARVRAHFRRHGRSFPDSIGDDADAAFDLLMDEFVLPTLPTDRLAFVHGWPPSRAALARVAPGPDGRAVAERFELYLGTLELGNGYHELADAAEQRHRFERELERRRALGRETPPVDERLLDALAAGLPDCAGVAVGLERLAMAIGGFEHIDEVLAFGFERA